MRDADTQYASDVVGKTMAGHLFSQSSSEADESLRSVRAEVSEPRFFIKSHSPTIEKVEKNTDMDSARQNPAAPSVEPSSVTTIPDSDPDGPLAHMQPAENDVDGTFQQSSPQQGQITSTPRIGSSAHFSAPPMPPDQPQPGETDRINRNAEADSDLSDVEVPPGTAACQQGVGSGLGSSTSRSVIFEVKAFEHTDSSASHSENTGEESNPQPAARSGKGTSLEIGQASALSDDGSNERSSRSRRGRSVLKRKVTKISVEVTPRTKKARVVSPRKPAPYTLDEDRSSCIASSSAMHLDSLQSGDEDSEPTQPSSQQERRDCGELVTPRVPSLPVNRVFAYHASAKSYFPAEIISLSKHRAQCLCDDGEIIWPMFKDMRICHLKVGDPVVYVGMDESQTTQESVAPPSLHYVYRVEWADKSGRVVPAETELGPSMIVAACEATDSQKKSRFQVRAIKIPVSQNSGTLNDRKLDATQLASLRAAGSAADPEGVLFGARPSSKERSSHGSRRSTSVPDTTGSPRFKREISSRSRSPRVESNLFEGYGFFLTGFVKDDEQPSVSTTQNPIEVRRSMPESEVRDLILRNGGSVLGEVSDIADVSINNEGKPTLKFAKSLESLRHILMVANEPRRGSFKYLMSLALGLPCISTMWLEQCTDHDILQPLGPAFIGSGLSFHYGTHVFGRQATLVVEQDLSFQGVLKRQAHFQLFSGKQILHVTTSSTKSPVCFAYMMTFAPVHEDSVLRPLMLQPACWLLLALQS